METKFIFFRFIFISAAAGVTVGVLVFIGIVVTLLWQKTNLVTPEKYHKAVAERLNNADAANVDIAWPWYCLFQLGADLRFIANRRARAYGATFTVPYRMIFEKMGVPSLFEVPLLAAIVPFAITYGVILVMANVLYLIVALVVVGLSRLCFVLLVRLLRGTEWLWATVHNAEASCPACYYVSPRPAYECPGCGSLHRDIRSGRLGVFERRCECGKIVPTMVIRSASQMIAVCQRCQEPLRKGAAAIRDVRIPIVGDVAAGKTRFMYATVDSLVAFGEKYATHITFPDSESNTLAERALDTVRSGRNTDKTDAELPRAFTFRVGSGASSSLIHMFDAAGEWYRGAANKEELGFLDASQGLVYIVDPFALGVVRAQVAGHAAARDPLAEAWGKDPDSTYSEVMSRVRGGGDASKRQRLAVVVSKADILGDCGVELPSDDRGLSSWLYDNGLHNLVTAAKHEFKEVKYYNVASIAADKASLANDPGRAVRWLLRSRGVKLPPEPGPVAVPEGASLT